MKAPGFGEQKEKKYLISACLTGERCRFDAAWKKNGEILKALDRMKCGYIAVCPEMSGGLPVPRVRARIINGDGCDVLDGAGVVLGVDGRDMTDFFISGAKEALRIANENGANEAILKERSPSCGVEEIHGDEGIIRGCGVTTALLKKNGLKVISDEDFLKKSLK